MTENTRVMPAVLRLPDVIHMVGMSRPSVYRMVKAGTFPQQVTLSPGTVGWIRSEVEAWLEKRMSSRVSRLAA